jgi:ubiquitin carboxyl-terminal hydrolase 7
VLFYPLYYNHYLYCHYSLFVVWEIFPDPTQLSIKEVTNSMNCVLAYSRSHFNRFKVLLICLASSISLLVFRFMFGRRRSNNNNNKASSTESATQVTAGEVIDTRQEELRINGLDNMGATCYLNSLLQSLFHLRVLRASIWQIQSNSSIIYALQSIFYHLQFGNSSVNTQKLLDSFGWSKYDAYVQHDVQELARMLIEKIEDSISSKKKNESDTSENIISKLFRGEFENYISCLYVDYTSRRREYFYDLQLTVTKSVYHSLKQFMKPDLLTGENKYYANDELKHQDALRGIRFIKLPPVLFIHLKRFEMSPAGIQRKLNTRCEFFNEMNLAEFIEPDKEARNAAADQQQWDYTLQSILVHSGSVNTGHYTCISNVSQDLHDKKWVLFDDNKARYISESEVFEPNFGNDLYDGKSAYMLIYIQKSVFNHVMCDVDKKMIRPKLIERIENENSCTIL